MTPVYFVKTTESYDVEFVTISRQTSYDSDILHQDYGIIRGLSKDHTGFADWDSLWAVPLSKRTKTGGLNYCIGPDCAGRAQLQSPIITVSHCTVLYYSL